LQHIHFYYSKHFDKEAPGWLGAAISKTTSFRKYEGDRETTDKSFERALVISEVSKELYDEHKPLRSEVIFRRTEIRELYVEHKSGKLRCENSVAAFPEIEHQQLVFQI